MRVQFSTASGTTGQLHFNSVCTDTAVFLPATIPSVGQQVLDRLCLFTQYRTEIPRAD